MVKYYYKVMGICCFIFDAFAPVCQDSEDIKDRVLSNYIRRTSDPNNGIIYNYTLNSIPSSTNDPQYIRQILFQLSQAIMYHELTLHQRLATNEIWIAVHQYSPHTRDSDIYGVMPCNGRCLEIKTAISEDSTASTSRQLVIYRK